MRDRQHGVFYDIAFQAMQGIDGGAEVAAVEAFRALYGNPGRTDSRHLPQLEVIRGAVARAWSGGLGAAAEAVALSQNGATGDPAAPPAAQEAQLQGAERGHGAGAAATGVGVSTSASGTAGWADSPVP